MVLSTTIMELGRFNLGTEGPVNFRLNKSYIIECLQLMLNELSWGLLACFQVRI